MHRVVWQVAVPEAGVDPAAERLDALIELELTEMTRTSLFRGLPPREDGVDGVVDVEQIVADFDSRAERDFRAAFDVGRVVGDAESRSAAASAFSITSRPSSMAEASASDVSSSFTVIVAPTGRSTSRWNWTSPLTRVGGTAGGRCTGRGGEQHG